MQLNKRKTYPLLMTIATVDTFKYYYRTEHEWRHQKVEVPFLWLICAKSCFALRASDEARRHDIAAICRVSPPPGEAKTRNIKAPNDR